MSFCVALSRFLVVSSMSGKINFHSYNLIRIARTCDPSDELCHHDPKLPIATVRLGCESGS